ncbi:helix-turn-helix transcriptional regulator [Kribbella sp.]|uniref:helix-turn-helix domain-containing protein n=1 Tax=Kribbella sp. TaxID=1871183 RepID=UPI002D433DA1|nr:helix-turn-helix transcriptional regulator [Kribbella sp.]HZX04025.1 helix-turn-helix transcriptional regulator [Kribbella sp.]
MVPRAGGPPTVRLRRLAGEMKALRAEAKLTREQVEERTGVNQGTLWRIEKGHAKPHSGTLETLFDLYGVPSARRAELIELTRGAHQPGWLDQFKDALLKKVISEGYATYIGFEFEAKAVHTYESLYVPGLLQTEDYARTVMIDGWPTEPDAVEPRVRTRMERQAVLTQRRDGRDPLEFWAVIDEAVLRRQVGDRSVMRAQLGRLLEMSERPNITLQVVPFDRGAHPGMSGAFSCIKFGTSTPDIIHTDSLAGAVFLELDVEIERFAFAFDHLRAMALSPRDSSALIGGLLKQ